MNVGIAILVIISVIILGQLLLQRSQRRREFQEILRKLDEIIGSLAK
jgi:low affinity Fe/Cu permease